MKDLLDYADGVAGFAALLNGLLLWPTVRGLKRAVEEIKEGRRGRTRKRTGRTRTRR